MEPTRPSLPRLVALAPEPVRLHEDEACDEALRRDLTASLDAVVVGLDLEAIGAELFARVAGAPRDACG